MNTAIELHQVRSFSERMVDVHKAVLNVLDGINEIIQRLAKTAEGLGDLGKQIGYAVQSWAALIAAVVAYFTAYDPKRTWWDITDVFGQ